MTTITDVKKRIAAEIAEKKNPQSDRLSKVLMAGDMVLMREYLLFHIDGKEFFNRMDSLLSLISTSFEDQPVAVRQTMLAFLADFSIDLSSYLPEWHLAKEISPDQLMRAKAQVDDAILHFCDRDSDIARLIHDNYRAVEVYRLKAEGLSDDEAAHEAKKLLGATLPDYIKYLSDETLSSTLRQSAGEQTEIGNDYATFLDYALRIGASFATTNPVLVKLAWDLDPPLWTPVVDALIKKSLARFAGETRGAKNHIEQVASALTMSVVEQNCRKLRGIYLATEGRQGYVSLQINPKNHSDSTLMIDEVMRLYAGLEESIGGVPNVVFKLPSTDAGLAAAEVITRRGIGVTITVTFAATQAVEFAKVLRLGNAPVCYIALMNGRLAYPVRDELKESWGDQGVLDARFAGVEVAKKVNRLLYGPADDGGLAIDRSRVRIMIASLRIYDGLIPDVTDLWGIPLITIFPNVRRALDLGKLPLNAESVRVPSEKSVLQGLAKSELFRQAWWLPEEGNAFEPEYPLSMEPLGRDRLFAWAPVFQTLSQFIELYDEMSEMIRDRLGAIQ